MSQSMYTPIFESTRGEALETIHYGAFAIVDRHGSLIAAHGDPQAVTSLRSSAKPFQAMPFIENGGAQHWGFSEQEIAITCASHAGTDDHFAVLTQMQAKINLSQEDLLCGVHEPIDTNTQRQMIRAGLAPTPNRHNCSGKHTGMLAYAQMIGASLSDYINPEHPIQRQILTAFCEMCDLALEDVLIGIDGCSAPVFAVPLQNAALGYARLADPRELPPQRAQACQTITQAMMAYPNMIAGPGKFDTRLMEVLKGKVFSKGGAAGYQQFGILPGVITPNSPGYGVAIKISDGDGRGTVRPAVSLEILRLMGAINAEELAALAEFGPTSPVKNWENRLVGQSYPTFSFHFDRP